MIIKIVIIQFFILHLLISELFSGTNHSLNWKEKYTGKYYTGVAETEIEYFEYDLSTNQNKFIEERIYNYEIEIFISDPLSFDTIVEENPFHISIYPFRETSDSEEGDIDVTSAIIYEDPFLGQVLLQYWTINLVDNNITGILTDTHIAESAAFNFIWAWEEITSGIKITWPFIIAEETKMNGIMGSDNINLEIDGESTNSLRKFKTAINANINVGVDEYQQIQPLKFHIYQNYPNPFNSSTVISFELPNFTDVIISVYNLKGEKISELFRGKKEAGIHSLIWNVNTNKLSSGIYLIKIQTADIIQIKKCTFLK